MDIKCFHFIKRINGVVKKEEKRRNKAFPKKINKYEIHSSYIEKTPSLTKNNIIFKNKDSYNF